MLEKGILREKTPPVKEPILIAGFDGWGNAMDVSKTMASYLVRKLKAESFATLNADLFYRYDENRPVVLIENGVLKDVVPPGGTFYAAHCIPQEVDLILLKAQEPSLRWKYFGEQLLALSRELQVRTIITLGSMYDNVLHSDTIVSGIASDEALSARLRDLDVLPINYQGPSAIHSTIQAAAEKNGIPCMSLWCHCPYYLQGATHFGLLSHLGSLLSALAGFDLDTDELDASWKELNRQIQTLVEKNPELQGMISELRKAKVRGSWAMMRESDNKDSKIIQLKDFLKPKQ
ncbi:MAG: PAC2 family protein [Deltaproteobacteria bacterium]|nr:PAC2 family protein [Deltaproteobacteria bacterium]